MTTAKQDKIGATPAKLALIAVLAIVLMLVLFNQPDNTPPSSVAQPEEKSETTQRTSPKAGKAEQADEASTPEMLLPDYPDWPLYALDQIIEFDPFSAPPWLQARSASISTDQLKSDRETLRKLKQQGASIVVITLDKKTATVGDQEFRIGDVVAGHQIIDITTRGIILRELRQN